MLPLPLAAFFLCELFDLRTPRKGRPTVVWHQVGETAVIFPAVPWAQPRLANFDCAEVLTKRRVQSPEDFLETLLGVLWLAG